MWQFTHDYLVLGILVHFHEIICGKNIFGNFLSNLLHFHEKTYYDCSFFTFAPLESPKFDGDAKQTMEFRVERKRSNRSKFSRENEEGFF